MMMMIRPKGKHDKAGTRIGTTITVQRNKNTMILFGGNQQQQEAEEDEKDPLIRLNKWLAKRMPIFMIGMGEWIIIVNFPPGPEKMFWLGLYTFILWMYVISARH